MNKNVTLSDDEADPSASFADLGLNEALVRAVADTGYEAPSPIQRAAIPALLKGRDVIGQAQTGTGKTAAFALPALQSIDIDARYPQLLVLTPTRELAIQVAEALQTYARPLKGFHVLPVYGGQGMDTQLRQLKRGVHVVVGTPGRVQDHIRRRTLDLSRLRMVVLDEADEMLRMGFVDDVDAILEHTPEDKQVALFSATMPAPIRKIAQKHLSNPQEIKIKTKTATVSTVRQRYCQVTSKQKLNAITRLLEAENFDAMVIFVRTKNATVELAEKLEARGFSSSALNGDMNQMLRERTISRLKSGDLDVLVATDVAARGLDVERISHVLNYDIPYDTEAYIHRVGRTARAGRTGEAILFVAPREQRMLRAIEKASGQKIEEMDLPSPEDIADRRIDQFKNMITETRESIELAPYAAVIQAYREEHEVDNEQVAAALAYLLQKERPLVPEKVPRGAPRDRKDRERDDREPRARRDRDPREKNSREKSKGKRESADDRSRRSVEDGMIRYRLAVGEVHEVAAKHIVGAIANEAGLDSEYMGRIEIYERHSTIELPDGMPKDIFEHLRKVRVRGERLRIAPDSEFEAGRPRLDISNDKPKKPKKKKNKNRERQRKDKGKRTKT